MFDLRRLTQVLFALGMLGVIQVSFGLATGRFRRIGPDIFADSDPERFRQRLVLYGTLAFFGITGWAFVRVWLWLRGPE
jgi:hypothetical protein